MRRALRRAASFLGLGLGLPLACDVGERATDPPRGPTLHLLTRAPEIGEGAACAPADAACGVPRNASVQVELDRPLLPATAVRQSIRIFSGNARVAAPFFRPRYDLLSLRLTFDFDSLLEAKTLYRVEFFDGITAGVRLKAFDGAPLAEPDRSEPWSFLTSARTDALLEPQAPVREPTCGDIVARLSASCSSAACHGGEEPVMGLSFENTDAMKRTAFNRVAHETETGDQIGVPFEDPIRFGVAMPVIDPGAAHNSYLVYKLLLAPENLAPCAGPDCELFADLPGAGACRGVSPEERTRIGEWFVAGDPMPPARDLFAHTESLPRSHYLDCGFMRALTRWIDAGAACE